MNETRRSQRLATDFSIARILAADEPSSSSSPSIFVRSSANCSEGDRVPKLPTVTCSCCPSVVISTTERKSLVPIIEKNQSEVIGNSGINDVQLDNRCLERSAVMVEIPARHPTTDSQDNNKGTNDLPWLYCTRYRPPRLPKRSSAGKVSKRRPGKHPRIPFTAHQLQILEDKYSKGAYLARRDVVQLSLILRLPQSRVKIWFQNRRARERRESLQSVNDAGNSEVTRDNNTPFHELE